MLDLLPPNCVLFLDFDGVLQTPALESWQEMEHCSELHGILREMPNLPIVVVSSHREGKSLETVQNMLPAEIGPRVVSTTPVTALGRARGGRQAEIETWLREHPLVESWAAVDDEEFLYQIGCPWVVVTHKWVGWDQRTSQKVRQLLKSRAKVAQ